MVALALLIGLAFPWGAIGGLRVESAEQIAGPSPARSADPADTPRKIAVTFSLPADVDQIREDRGADFIRAVLSACEKAEVNQTIEIARDTTGFRDPRVQELSPAGAGRQRYRVLFDDRLAIERGSTTEFVSALDTGGGLCFSLRGGAMWMGRLWSKSIRLRLARPAGSIG